MNDVSQLLFLYMFLLFLHVFSLETYVHIIYCNTSFAEILNRKFEFVSLAHCYVYFDVNEDL